MKIKIIASLVCLLTFSVAFAQDLVERKFYEDNPRLGGDVVIKSIEIKFDEEDKVEKIFEIESFSNGSFYCDAWVMAPLTSSGYPEYKVTVNDIVSSAILKPQTNGWHNAALTDSDKSRVTITLKKGKNFVSIWGKGPEIPSVEFLKFSSSSLNLGISDRDYKSYIENIKLNTLESSYLAIDADSILNTTKVIGGDYVYMLDMPINYTWYNSFAYKEGKVLNIKTKQNGIFQYVIDVFSWTEPESYSWSK